MKSGVLISLLILSMFSIPCANAAQNDNSSKVTGKYAKKAHEAFEDKDFLRAGVYYEKAYRANKNKVYLENSIIAYLRYSFDSLNEKKYEEAIKYCVKVLSLQPNNRDAKEILADIYYSRGTDLYYSGKEGKARKDLEKSLQYSILTEQKQRAKKLLSKISDKRLRSGYSKSYIKKTSGHNSMPEILELMELKIYGETFEKSSMYERIGKLERDVFGRTYKNNGLIVRMKRLKSKVLPELISRGSTINLKSKDFSTFNTGCF